MSDAGVPSLDSMLHTHTSTEEWQSFEVRMRQRRIARCLLRADVAIDAGCTNDAREALEEVRRLGASSPELTRLELRLAQAPAPIEAAAEAFDRVEKPIADAHVSTLPIARVEAGGRTAPVADPLTAAAASAPPLRRRALVMSLSACAVVLIAGWVVGRQATAPARLQIQQLAQAEIAIPNAADSVTVAVQDAVADTVAVVDTVIDTPTPLPVTAEATPPDAKLALAEPEPTRSADTVAPSAAPLPMPPRAAAPLPIVSLLPMPTAGPLAAPTSGTVPAPARDAEPGPAGTPRLPRAASAPAADEGVRVRAVLARYEAAYSGLDAAAAHAVWPGVDERALARAFDGLASQRLSLGLCDVAVEGGMARADCSGSATWTPKVGGGGRTQGRRWRFDLQNADGGWHITRAQTR